MTNRANFGVVSQEHPTTDVGRTFLSARSCRPDTFDAARITRIPYIVHNVVTSKTQEAIPVLYMQMQ